LLNKSCDKLRSCIYKLDVVHQRLHPQKHRFKYALFMFMLDLDESAEINSRLKLAKVNRQALYRFDDRDHFDLNTSPTREKLIAFLSREGITQEIGRILLLTNFRFLGYVFNPVSIYFVHDKSDAPMLAVAEVGNTFLERKPFLLPISFDQQTGKTKFILSAPKHFYVSPFSRVDDTFEFKVDIPGEFLEVNINTKAGSPNKSMETQSSQPLAAGQTLVASSMKGSKIELTDRNITSCTLSYPFVTIGIIGLIHFHALLLWLKKVPFFTKEENPHSQTGVLNPHRSLQDTDSKTEKSEETLDVHAYKGATQ